MEEGKEEERGRWLVQDLCGARRGGGEAGNGDGHGEIFLYPPVSLFGSMCLTLRSGKEGREGGVSHTSVPEWKEEGV